ncbi:TonB-dependent receptor [Sphingobacterium spiritivorum]|uniref:TonB-linked outer membrane protein, SusC/RagA family n=1 Tax=Sphingobacterium spiritivorum ATCC 33861 TaxID=525373 RepID=D7VSG4_SPHSI|nr:TonB-dependent receptor [Sphingobacterium spiritivorum]EFK56715.1 TonB-linked outer membrane protein, SusC/RagA family [Sphingobacterium spiritivorum ATCC 33861]WQD36160.1 TonB-dependent receptor [Sphingobacterium spiritivorum]SUJ04315.1 Outer membrane cobalamin receptor protein [Sphingobacterium spiritivorum]
MNLIISFKQSFGLKQIFRRSLNKKPVLWIKCTTLFLCLMLCHIYSSAYSQNINLSFKNEKLGKVLRSISQQSGYRIFYNSELLKGTKPVSIDIKAGTLNKVLDLVFVDQPLNYRLEGKSIRISRQIPVKTMAINTTGENFQETITGTVTDSMGNSLSGVTVKIKGTNNITSTDAQGYFKLARAQQGNVTLVFSYIGYQTFESIYTGSPLHVAMKTEISDLAEIVVIGYGTVKKSDLTGSVSTISAAQLGQVNGVSNVAQALQGHAPGVRVNQASGQPGEGMKIQIRGTNSLAASNDPLYVVDGMMLDGLTAQINPDDIESVSVLKDASSTAIYGSRGANGVIMITTKKGASGKTKVSYNNYLGAQVLRKKIDVINATDFATLQNEVAVNDGKPLPWTQTQINELGKGTDWQDLVYRTASVQTHNLSLSGGNQDTKYFTSFGYFDQDGIIRNSGFKRLSLRSNIDHKLFDKVNLITNLSIQNSAYDRAQYQSADGGGGIPWSSMVLPPTMQVYDADGNYTKFTGVSWGETNPVGLSENWKNRSNNLRIIGNVAVSYEIIDGLKLKLSAGLDHAYNKRDTYYPGNISLGQRTVDGKPVFGIANKLYGSSTTFINDNILEYQKQFGDKHKLDALVGLTYQTSKNDELNSGTGIGFASDTYETSNIQSAITKALPSSTFGDNRLLSYMARANYSYADKYFFTISGRRDGSSRFGANNKYAFFPSAAVAWTVSKEDFLKDNTTLSLLKIRTSYGESGNQAIANYQTLANVSDRDAIFNNQINTGFILAALENANLKWETTRQYDIGMDMGLFNNKIQIVADYYNKRTKDLLLNVTLPGSGGFGSVLQNIGVVQNKGFEFQISAQPRLGEHLRWNPSFNISLNRTKVLDMGVDAYGKPVTFKEIGTGGNWFPTIVGQSMMQLYGYTVEGVYQTDQEAVANGEPSKKAGDYRFKNWDGQGTVNDQDDRTVLSRLEPKFTFGFNNGFTYKNFDFSFLMVGSYGNDIVNEFRKYNISLNGSWAPTQEGFDNRWKGTGQGNTFDKPSAKSGSPIRDYANSLWVENGSYLRLRDITLGYTLPLSVTDRLRISKVRVYVSAQNYLTITNYSGFDPEVSWASASVNGWDRGNYPATKSITAGIRVDF